MWCTDLFLKDLNPMDLKLKIVQKQLEIFLMANLHPLHFSSREGRQQGAADAFSSAPRPDIMGMHPSCVKELSDLICPSFVPEKNIA